MRQTVRFGRIAGIPVGSHWSVLVIMLLLVQVLALSVLPGSAPGHRGLLYWSVAVLVAVLFMAALLGHELGHALVARHYGVRVRGITLWLLGGVSELDGQAPHARGDFLIALAGPLVSFAAAFGFGALAALASALDAGALAVTALAWLAVINAVLGLFNLLPGTPLDGGRVLAAALWWARGDRAAARRAANRAGMVLGAILIAAGFALVILAGDLGGLWLALIGWFVIAAAGAENTDVRLRDSLGTTTVEALMTGPAVVGYGHQNVTDFIAHVASTKPHRTYPVLDLDGRLTGVVSLARLGRVPPQQRSRVRLADLQTPRDRVTVLGPGTPLIDVAAGLLYGGHRLAPVVEQERLVGVVCTSDVAKMIDLAPFGLAPGRITNPPSPPAGSPGSR